MKAANEQAQFYIRARDAIGRAASDLPDNEFSGVSGLWSDFFASRPREQEVSNALRMLDRNYQGTMGVALKIHPKYIPLYAELYEDVYEPSEVPECSFVGSPDLIKVHDRFTNPAYLQNSVRSRDIIALVGEQLGRPVDVLEVGSGYGGMAEQLISAGVVNSYTIIDLPQNLLLASLYLYAHELGKEVNVCTDPDFSGAINMLLPQQVSTLQGRKFDLIVNCDSLGEMPAEVARAYVDLFSRALTDRGFFYSKNGHRRSPGTTEKITDFGYDKFALLRLGPSPVSSLMFDHHSHVAVFGNRSANSQSACLVGEEFDTVAELFRSGIGGELAELLENLVAGRPTEEDRAFLKAVDWLYRSGNPPGEHFASTDLNAALAYLSGLSRFVRGDTAAARTELEAYLADTRSPIAEAVSRFVLMQIDPKYIAESSYRHGARTRFLLGTLKLDLNKSVERKLLFTLRRQNIKRLIRPFEPPRPSVAVTAKNLFMNLWEGKGLSSRRLVQGEVRPFSGDGGR